jgi:hypothetical protein
MTIPSITAADLLGFVGDMLTFVGGMFLGYGALFEEKRKNAINTWEDARKKDLDVGIVMTWYGKELKDKDDVEIAVIRKLRWPAVWGAGFLAVGFCCLFCSRWSEVSHRKPAACSSIDKCVPLSENRNVGK